MDREGLEPNLPDYENAALQLYELAEELFNRRQVASSSTEYWYGNLKLTSDEIATITPVFQNSRLIAPNDIYISQTVHHETTNRHTLLVTTTHQESGITVFTTYKIVIQANVAQPVLMHKDVSSDLGMAVENEDGPPMAVESGTPVSANEQDALRQMLQSL